MDRFVNGEGIGPGDPRVELHQPDARSCSQHRPKRSDPVTRIVVCEQGTRSQHRLLGRTRTARRGDPMVASEPRHWIACSEGSRIRSLRTDPDRRLFRTSSNLLGENRGRPRPPPLWSMRPGGRVVVDGVAYCASSGDRRSRLETSTTTPGARTRSTDLTWVDSSHDTKRSPNSRGRITSSFRRDEIPYKFELGGVSHEGCAGLCALPHLLAFPCR